MIIIPTFFFLFFEFSENEEADFSGYPFVESSFSFDCFIPHPVSAVLSSPSRVCGCWAVLRDVDFVPCFLG